MTLVTIPAVGKFGLIADTLPQELDISAWSAGANVRFVNGAAELDVGQLLVEVAGDGAGLVVVDENGLVVESEPARSDAKAGAPPE